MSDIQWEIRREGRAWTEDEAEERYFSAPEKLETVGGKLYEPIPEPSAEKGTGTFCSEDSAK